jgi:hypothetical protein
MLKIQRLSHFLKYVFQLLLILWPILFVMAWIFLSPIDLNDPRGFNFKVYFIPNFEKVLHPISLLTRIEAMAIGFLPLCVDLFIIYSLLKLFSLYEKGEIFSSKNVYYIKRAGIGLLLSQLISPIYQAIITMLLTWNNPAGQRYIAMTFDQFNLSAILIALMIILIAWIMLEACQLKEEQKLTV